MPTVTEYLPFLVRGAVITVQISVLAIALASVIGLAVAGLRMARLRVLRAVGTAYINVFRATPLLVQFLWIYFALPIVVGVSLPVFVASVIALGLYTGAFLAEVLRAGILSVEGVQREAGLALGMGRGLAFRRVVLPQAVQRMAPTIATTFVTLVKDSSLASVLAVSELTRRGQEVVQQTLDPVAVFTVVGVLYLVLNLPLMWGVEAVYRRGQVDDSRAVRA